MNYLLVMCMIGLVLSSYAVYVEQQKELNPSFEALCDINSSVSCSKVFSSEQGKIWSYFGLIPKGHFLDQPNAVYGLLFYTAVLVLELLFRKSKLGVTLQFILAIFGCILSLYLGYVLKFVLHDFCMVCVGTYICNTVILLGSHNRYKKINSHSIGKNGKSQ